MPDPRFDDGPVIKVEFYNIELAPLADGRVYVSMLATKDAFAVIRQGVARACPGP
jgi:hypothetical protein